MTLALALFSVLRLFHENRCRLLEKVRNRLLHADEFP
jgi:hypothetical protein